MKRSRDECYVHLLKCLHLHSAKIELVLEVHVANHGAELFESDSSIAVLNQEENVTTSRQTHQFPSRIKSVFHLPDRGS